MGGASPTSLTKKWNHIEEDTMFWSSPLVQNGRTYAAWCYLDPPDSYGAVVCLDAETGKKIWETDVKTDGTEFKGFFSSPALTADGKYLIIGQGLHPDYDSELVCLNAKTGAVKWTIHTPLHIEGSPAISGDIVVAGIGAVEDASTHKPKSHPDPEKNKNAGLVIAVQISTGEVLWKQVVSDPESSPAIADGVVYIGSGFNGNAVVALDLESGKELWKVSTPHPATGALTIYKDMLLVGCGNGDYVFAANKPDGYVLAIERKSGKLLWQQQMGDAVLGAIAVEGDVAIAPVRNGIIAALDLTATDSSKREMWKTQVRKGARALAGPAFTGTHVYAISHDGYLVVLDAKDGKEIEKHFINSLPGEMGMSIASPMVIDGKVYVGSETGGVRCYIGKESK
jgi:outer membrane protein assembly factor BamB